MQTSTDLNGLYVHNGEEGYVGDQNHRLFTNGYVDLHDFTSLSNECLAADCEFHEHGEESDESNDSDSSGDSVDEHDEEDGLNLSVGEGDDYSHHSDDDDEDQYGVNASNAINTLWVPRGADEIKPKIGQRFVNHESAEQFYRDYAEVAGFEVRLSNRNANDDGIVTHRYFLCNKQGIPKNKKFDTLQILPGKRKKRNTNFKRCGCRARFKVKYDSKTKDYVVYEFIEHHNHELLTPDEMLFTRSKRQLSYIEQKNVFLSYTSKVGVSKIHRMRKSMRRGISGPGGTERDYYNFKRDIAKFVGVKDAQMFIDKHLSRQKICPEYFIEYKLNDKELEAIFWADETARMNYKEFGDVISFDATFRTNQHAMVFVPFVAVDNHKRTVVVGAALMRAETVVDYTWVLNAFMKAHGRQPSFVITDQCAAIRKVVPKIFPESKHRFCLWHIMEKVKTKVGVDLATNSSFVIEMSALVWDVNLEPVDFESQWMLLMEKFRLVGVKWFKFMFRIREKWIPAYYKNLPMSGLMKTTSRSESINAFFNVFHAFHHDLVVFLHSFDIAIEQQRNKHCIRELQTKSTTPRIVSPSNLEIHASKVYTRTIFFDVQEELSKAVWNCRWGVAVEDAGKRVIQISQKDTQSGGHTMYKVVQDTVSGDVECSCNFFVRHGYLCRHAFKVLLNDEVDMIPEQYVVRRWTRDIIPIQWLPAAVRYGEIDADKERLIGKVNLIIESIIEDVRNDKDSLVAFVNEVEKLKYVFSGVCSFKTRAERRMENIQEFLAVKQPESVDVLPPTGIRNKGCGTGKRLVGSREKAIKQAKKMKRRCQACKKFARHDSRNCPEFGRKK